MTPYEKAERLFSKVADAEVYTFKEVSHVPFIEKPDTFNDMAAKFI